MCQITLNLDYLCQTFGHLKLSLNRGVPVVVGHILPCPVFPNSSISKSSGYFKEPTKLHLNFDLNLSLYTITYMKQRKKSPKYRDYWYATLPPLPWEPPSRNSRKFHALEHFFSVHVFYMYPNYMNYTVSHSDDSSSCCGRAHDQIFSLLSQAQ